MLRTTILLAALALAGTGLAACSDDPSKVASTERTSTPVASASGSTDFPSKRPRLSCPGVKTSSDFEWGFSGPPPPRGGLSDADALAEVARVVRRRHLDVNHARYVVLAKHGTQEARSYLVPDSSGRSMAQVEISTVASQRSKERDRWIADAWAYCN